MRQINKKGNHLKEFYRYSYDNQRISGLLDRIESTDNQRKIERAYDFIHRACDNIDDCLQSGWYDLSDASWAYGTDYVIEELTDILNESVCKKRARRLTENDEDVKRFTQIIANQSDKDLIAYLERIAVQNYVQGYGQSEGMLQIIREELLRRMS